MHEHRAAPRRLRRGLTALAATVAALTTLLGATTTGAHADDGTPAPWTPPTDHPVRIMLAGDSITHQFSGDDTWRWRLWTELTRQHVSFDFVGPFTTVYGAAPHGYLHPGFDEDNAGIGGTTYAARATEIAAWVTTYQPDVLMVELGTNDLRHDTSPDQLMAITRDYVDTVRRVSPTTMVALAEVDDNLVYPSGQVSPLMGTANRTYDDLLDAYVADEQAQGEPVRLIDTETGGWQPRRMTTDGVHPTPVGETYLAQKYADTLHALGILPQPASILSTSATWNPPTTATVKVASRAVRHVIVRHHRRVVQWTRRPRALVTLSWQAAQTDDRLTQGVIRVYRGEKLVATRTAGRYVPHVTVRLAPGNYHYTLQGIRDWLTGVAGPQRAFTVR